MSDSEGYKMEIMIELSETELDLISGGAEVAADATFNWSTTQGANIVVSVIDTGIALGHEALQATASA